MLSVLAFLGVRYFGSERLRHFKNGHFVRIPDRDRDQVGPRVFIDQHRDSEALLRLELAERQMTHISAHLVQAKSG